MPQLNITSLKHVKGSIHLSHNRLPYGYYIVVVDSKVILALHTANIFEVTRRGVPLARWRSGVTVLLEKLSGKTLGTKLRTLLPFEANFNY